MNYEVPTKYVVSSIEVRNYSNAIQGVAAIPQVQSFSTMSDDAEIPSAILHLNSTDFRFPVDPGIGTHVVEAVRIVKDWIGGK